MRPYHEMLALMQDTGITFCGDGMAMKKRILAAVAGSLVLAGLAAVALSAESKTQLRTIASSERTANAKLSETNRVRMMAQALAGNQEANKVLNTTELTSVPDRNSGQNSSRKVATIEQTNASVTPNAHVVNDTSIAASRNLTTGKGAVTHLGTIFIADVKISGEILSSTEIKDSHNEAIGNGNVAKMGSVAITDSTISRSAKIVNRAAIGKAQNSSTGTKNTASMGTVNVNTSRIDGQAENIAKMESSENIAKGTGNTANIGVIDLTNSSVGKPGSLTNTSRSEKVLNMGAGFHNKSSTASVQLE